MSFDNPTVFLLGAGASWHYSYPTGEQLVKDAIDTAHQLADFFSRHVSVPERPLFVERHMPGVRTQIGEIAEGWKKAAAECADLEDRLRRVNPLVIDYFLGLNPSLQVVGKFVIAAVLLRCEAEHRKKQGNINRRIVLQNSPRRSDREESGNIDVKSYQDDWYRFVVHKLIINCNEPVHLLNKPVKFITFNYDMSLEHALIRGLGAIDIFSDDDVTRFVSNDRIIHVYGKIRDFTDVDDNFDWGSLQKAASNPLENPKGYDAAYNVLNKAYKASQTINTIDPHNKTKNTIEIKKAADAIRDASVVYVLGYGFDKNNNDRLNLRDSLGFVTNPGETLHKYIMFTNLRNSGRVNKAASRLFFGVSNRFDQQSIFEWNAYGQYYCEKSVKDVYEALATDFDSVEDYF